MHAFDLSFIVKQPFLANQGIFLRQIFQANHDSKTLHTNCEIVNEHPCLPLDNNFLDVCRNCIIKLFKILKFLVIFFLPPKTVFLLLIIIWQESAEAALNVR